jgi:putative transposase
MDNFSKMILGFAVADKLSFFLVVEAIRQAIPQMDVDGEAQEDIKLVADGGKENNNKEVETFLLNQEFYRLSKVVALKDIQFSNSPIEAIHKIMKGRYLVTAHLTQLSYYRTFLKDAGP